MTARFVHEAWSPTSPAFSRVLAIVTAIFPGAWCHDRFDFVAAATSGKQDLSDVHVRQLNEFDNSSNNTEGIAHTKTTSDAEYLCGQYERRCEPVAKIPPNGPDLWMLSKFTYNRDNTYVYEEHGFLNSSRCVAGDPWLLLRYEGIWDGDGLSPYRRDQSVASIYITSVWLRLLHEEVCVTNHHDGSTNCLNTLAALQVLCPCNGWDWSIGQGKQSRERNIGMFCRPLEQCPLIHQVFLQKTQYITYSASRESACFSQASSEVVVGWENPQVDAPACLSKREAMSCTVAQSGAARTLDSSWWRCIALLVLVASVLPAGLPEAFL